MAVLRSPQMCQNWLLMDKNEIIMSFCFKDESCGLCPKLGGTADKHIRPCHVDGRAFLLRLSQRELL